MIWERLKEMKCPKCRSALKENMLGYACVSGDFSISRAKFEETIISLYTPKRRTFGLTPTEEDNLSALNNLGRRKVSEDYSDSPHLL